MHPEDAASALALRGRSVGCAEVMEKHSGDQSCSSPLTAGSSQPQDYDMCCLCYCTGRPGEKGK